MILYSIFILSYCASLFLILQARLAKKSFFMDSICHAITDPPVTKIPLWPSFGV